MNAAKTTLQLGDTLEGIHHGVTVTGILTGFDGSGYLYIKFAEPVTIYGVARDGIAVDRDQRQNFRIVGRVELQAGDVKALPSHAVGGEYLSKEALARIAGGV